MNMIHVSAHTRGEVEGMGGGYAGRGGVGGVVVPYKSDQKPISFHLT